MCAATYLKLILLFFNGPLYRIKITNSDFRQKQMLNAAIKQIAAEHSLLMTGKQERGSGLFSIEGAPVRCRRSDVGWRGIGGAMSSSIAH
jgi:hypothetical protein